MKKVIVVLMVLSMATMANAALYISVNGTANGTVTSAPSQTATIAISTDTTMGYGKGDWAALVLVCNSSMGSITGGVSLYPQEPGIALFNTADLSFSDSILAGIGFTLGFTGPDIPAGKIIDAIHYHSEGPGDVAVTLYGSADGFANRITLASVTITQTPEPTTIGLLVIGGLFLRRKHS